MIEGKLTIDECRLIYSFQQYLGKISGVDRPKIAETGVILRLLRTRDIPFLLSRQQFYCDEEKSFPDPIDQPTKRHVEESKSKWVMVIYALIGGATLAIYLFATIQYAAFFLAVSSFLERATAKTPLSKVALDYTIGLSRFKNMMMVGAGFLCAGYVIWCSRQTPLTPSMGYRILASAICLSVIFMCLLVAWAIKTDKVKWGEFRDRQSLAVMQFLRGGKTAEPDQAEAIASQILQRSNALLSLNVYDAWLWRIPWIKRTTVNTLWYLEPVKPQQPADPANEQKLTFRIVAFSPPTHDPELQQAMKIIQSEHHPKWDGDVFDDVRSKHWSPSDGFDQKGFESEMASSESVSITGWVFSKGQAMQANTPNELRWLTKGYRQALTRHLMLPAQDLLDFRSCAGFPVENRQGDVVGVVLACRNRIRGFVACDIECLILTAECLSMALHGKCVHEDQEVKSDDRN